MSEVLRCDIHGNTHSCRTKVGVKVVQFVQKNAEISFHGNILLLLHGQFAEVSFVRNQPGNLVVQFMLEIPKQIAKQINKICYYFSHIFNTISTCVMPIHLTL